MYEVLIDKLISTFATPGETEHQFLEQVRQADVRLCHQFQTSSRVRSDCYVDPLIRSAYLLRYLGHYTLQMGDLLMDLEGTAAQSIIQASNLSVGALCGGPCPEVIALANLHRSGHCEQLNVVVMDHNARHWADCWPIVREIAENYTKHPNVIVKGLNIELFDPSISPAEEAVLHSIDFFSMMNCFNELIGRNPLVLRRSLAERLRMLRPGTIVVASDQANYRSTSQGLHLLHELLEHRGAQILFSDVKDESLKLAENRFDVPERIAWLYSSATRNNFRIYTKQRRLAAILA